MKNKGFTLVELLAVIVILALLITIAVPNVIAISKKIRGEMFCEKVSMIVDAAKLYGQDNFDVINKKISNGNTVTITVADLINNNYLKREDKNCTVNSSNNPCVKDPRTNNSMDNKTVKIEIRNKRTYPIYNFANEKEKKSCENK